MYGIYFKVNRKGQYKNYMNGSFTETSKAFHELMDRATSKGFQKVSRSQGTGGVNLTYSDGKTRVELVFVQSDKDREWLAFYDECQAKREVKENKAA